MIHNSLFVRLAQHLVETGFSPNLHHFKRVAAAHKASLMKASGHMAKAAMFNAKGMDHLAKCAGSMVAAKRAGKDRVETYG